ncbi:MAG: hypothetical protein JO072_11015 [Parafilimonas sp.]|nr:hypothetical protein [Parafilimonas sp.]
MKKQITLVSILLIFMAGAAEAQYYGGGVYMQRGYRRPPPRQRYQQRRPKKPPFQPTVNLSVGYGFPNLDKNYLADFYEAYKGTSPTQTGPVTAALDYQFSRYNSIGVMGTYGKVSLPYYDISSNSGVPDFTGSLENWSIMFNMMSYFPSYQTVSPYIRTAIGINNWKQNYTYPDGSKAAVAENPTTLAYQVSIGTRFNLSPNAGFYIEAGYGKYIVNGGLTFRF